MDDISDLAVTPQMELETPVTGPPPQREAEAQHSGMWRPKNDAGEFEEIPYEEVWPEHPGGLRGHHPLWWLVRRQQEAEADADFAAGRVYKPTDVEDLLRHLHDASEAERARAGSL